MHSHNSVSAHFFNALCLSAAAMVILAGCHNFGNSRTPDYLNDLPSSSGGTSNSTTTPGPTRLGGQGMLGN